ncbi:Uncharacterised protein [Mycobacteroides abscessus subsp. abscessus]|nr:Uncharacterised protein [Mycobacteroides abscessus subsp. abscessus]
MASMAAVSPLARPIPYTSRENGSPLRRCLLGFPIHSGLLSS